jgi:hypothetical protein
MSDLITQLPPEFLKEFEDEILGRIPEEKAQVQLRQVENARIAQAIGSTHIEGLGQKVAEIDARLYFRMYQAFGHEENWLNDFLRTNPELCAPGYKPRGKSLGQGKTFIGGKPV